MQTGKDRSFTIERLVKIVLIARVSIIKGRARYRPIDDRARYWAKFFFWMRLGKLNLENFQRKKKSKKGRCRE